MRVVVICIYFIAAFCIHVTAASRSGRPNSGSVAVPAIKVKVNVDLYSALS